MTKKYSPLTLPCNYDEMEKYIVNNKVKLTEQVITSVQYAMENDLSSIEVFKFKNSDFVVMLENNSYEENVSNILKYYLDEELYELCERVTVVKSNLENYEKKQTKRYKSKNSTE